MINPKIFKAYDIRAIYPEPLNEDCAWRIGYGSAKFLQAQVKAKQESSTTKPNTIVVSRDMRPHSPQLTNALIQGIRSAGTDVIDLGMCDTSIIYFAVNHFGSVGGIQVTASHNPINYNGFKISGQLAKPIGQDTGLTEIQKLAGDVDPSQYKPTGNLEEIDNWDEYKKHIHSFYTPTKRKIKIAIDASNGMAGKLVPKIFEGMDNIEIVPINFEITGSFVHEPNPLVPENMIPTQEAVKAHGCDLGACFDGDADRCMITDENGVTIGCDHLTGLLTKHFTDQEPGSPIVFDLRSSKVVEQAIVKAGSKPVMGKVGHVNMKKALRDCEGIFGGELSGHFYFKDNFYADSGAIALMAVFSIIGQTDTPLSELVKPFRQFPQSGELNYVCETKEETMEAIKHKFPQGKTLDLDGVSVDCWDTDGWWINLRASNTEPLLRLNAEAKNQETLDKLLAEITPGLGTPDLGH